MSEYKTFGELGIGELFTLRKSRIMFEKRPVTLTDDNRMFNAHSGFTGRMFFLDNLTVIPVEVDMEPVELGVAA